jgi:hypothetical protein
MLISAKIASEQIEKLSREERFNNKVEHAIKMGEREFSFDTRFTKENRDKYNLFCDELETAGYFINSVPNFESNKLLIIVSF